MAQEETPVLPADIDVLEQAADVAARPSRRAERTTERATTRTPRETKSTRARAAATAAAAKAAPSVETVANETTIAPVAVQGSAQEAVQEAITPQIEFDTTPAPENSGQSSVTSNENAATERPWNQDTPVVAEPEKHTIENGTQAPVEMASSGVNESRSDDKSVEDAAEAEAVRAEVVSAGVNAEPVEAVNINRPPIRAVSPAEALPREERPLESRGVRFRGREGRVEVRGRQGMPIVNDPRAFRRQENEMRDPRESRDPRENREPREHGRDSEGNGLPGGRLASPMRDSRHEQREPREPREQRGEGREGRDGRGENREGQGRGRFERDLPRGRHELDLSTLEDKNLTELREIAKNLNIISATTLKKGDLVFKILEQQAENHGHQFKKGILDILPDGKGFLRTDGYLAGNEDVYVSQSQIKRFNLKTGDMVTGMVRPPKEMERHYGLLRVEAINGEAPDFSKARKEFERLTPIFPNKKFKLEMEQENITARVIDLVTPIGKGQRGLIVAPPKAGKTTLIKTIANSIAANHPEVILIVLLIDERPEEVTDIARSVKGEVVASTFDELPENHMRVAEMVFEKAKRLAEQKKDVVILMDSLTRLARASNLVVNPSGRTMTGGLDPAAMHRPKRMFGAARNIEEGGSLTILATVLVDTGSRMDEYIFEELKGTGNMDLVLDRGLFDSRVFPAIDINKSGTRRDDLLLSREDQNATMHLRRTLAALDNDKAINLLIDRLKNTKTNEEFMQIVQRSSRAQGNQ